MRQASEAEEAREMWPEDSSPTACVDCGAPLKGRRWRCADCMDVMERFEASEAADLDRHAAGTRRD